MLKIHQTAIIAESVKLGDEITIGPYAVIGEDTLGESELFRKQHPEHAKMGKICMLGRGVRIGSGAYIGVGSRLADGVTCQPQVYVGHYTDVGPDSHLMYGAQIHNAVRVGANAWIGGFVCNRAVLADNVVCFGKLVHRFVDADKEADTEASPIVEKGAVIAFNAVIVGGVRVGEGAYVGAGAVVVTDVAPNRLYLGVPARDTGPAPSPFKR
jgi:UDP-2-acetamido-3-amino-2,3-dideoxy-glucuronate N-acetyltransferase